MKLPSSYFANGALCALLAGSIAAACGSDSQHRNARSAGGDGSGGQGGMAGVTHAGAGSVKPEPLAGNGGQPAATAGMGGAPAAVTAGQGGVPMLGGAATEGGAAGAVDMLPVVNCDPVTFTDSELEAAIRNALDTGGVITPADIAGLTNLDAGNYHVTSLEGIECFTELSDVYLGQGGQGSSIANLAPLRYLKKLKTLDLSSNPLTDLAPLAKVPSLQNLNLRDAENPLDLAPLASAPSLVSLVLDRDKVSDLTPLSKIATLKLLDLNGAILSAPATLSSLKNVTELHVYNAIADATPVAAMTQLLTLDIGGNPNLANFNKLSTLVSLTSLDVDSTGITGITAVASMTKLTHLSATFNQIADLAPLQGLTALDTLYLNFNAFTSITPLVNNAGIGTGDSLNLGGNNVSCTDVNTLRGRGASVFDLSCP